MNLSTEFHPIPKPSKATKERKPMKKRRSAKARAKDFSSKVRAIVRERSQGICEMCHMHRAMEFHHAIYRSHGGTGDLENCIYLCKVCHDACHATEEKRKYAVKLAVELAHVSSVESER